MSELAIKNWQDKNKAGTLRWEHEDYVEMFKCGLLEWDMED